MGLTTEQMADAAMAKIEEGESPWFSVELVTEKYSEGVRRKVRRIVLDRLEEETGD